MNKRLKLIIITMSIFLTVSFGLNITRNTALPAELYDDSFLSWEITEISTGANQWYNVSSFGFMANWTASVGDELNFTINGYKSVGEKNYLKGIVEIGNLSLTTDDQDIGFNLALSVYPWYGGLVSLESNWNTLTNVQPLDNETNAQITYDKIVSNQGKQIAIVEIVYDDGAQQSIFQYEPTTGILILANTTAFGFSLGIELTSTTVPIPSVTSTVPFNTGLCVIGGFVVVITLRKRKQ